jgi:predicted acylesterase/phospholipase RssA
LGVMAALQEYGLQPSAIIGESRASIVAAGFALGYSASQLESVLLTEPFDGWILPFSRHVKTKVASGFSDTENNPFTWTLSGQSLQSEKGLWLEGPRDENPEFLHLAWMVGRLAEGAPKGPTPSIQNTPIPLAFQVYNTDKGILQTVAEGDLQDLLKACLFPPSTSRERPTVRPYSDGAQVSSHDIQLHNLPFQFDKLIALRLSRHLPRRMFGGMAANWRDSVNHGYHENQKFRLDSLAQVGKVDFIDIQPDAQGLAAHHPALWRDLGYQAALRHMDMLMQNMRATSKAQPPQGPTAEREVQITIDPLASGGRELLLDLLTANPLTESWSSGRKAMDAVMATGFYSQLDVSWQPPSPTAGEQWVFTAKEQSKIELWLAPNVVITPEPQSLRGPECLAGLSWSEPLFIPLKFEVMGAVGGREPGWAVQAFAQSLAPLPIRIGLRHLQTDMNHIDLDRLNFNAQGNRFGTSNFRMREKASGLFLDLWPTHQYQLGGEISMRHFRYGLLNDGLDSLRSQLEAKGQMCLGCKSATTTKAGPGMSLFYRSAETVSEGVVKAPQHAFGAREWLNLPFSKLVLDMVWTNWSEPNQVDVYDLYTLPQIDALSFADHFFFLSAKALRFVHARAELLPRLGDLQGRVSYGWIRHQGKTLLADTDQRTQKYWEVDLSYPTPFGPLRLGIGQFDAYDPLFVVQYGVNFNLRKALENSRL